MIGIIGMKTVITTGSMATKYIPPLHILVEDHLAQLVVDCICEQGTYISKKYILSGAWANQASCLYGFLTYGMEMEALKIPSFGIIAIVDGDIKLDSIEKRIKEVIKGNYKNPDQKEIIQKISNLTTSFNLELKPEGINAWPEYNHKKWFEQVTEEMVLTVNANMTNGFIQNDRDISSLLELIEFSKSIADDHNKIRNEKGKADYHSYYEILKEEFHARNTDHKMNNIHWYILSCIKHYNSSKWILYTKDVLEKISLAHKEQQQKFVGSNFDFR